ncbi:tRNA:m4X modification enzyme [Coemansia sp. RSA 1200]|nr:tRNA:m4X modification enzyme [Coemansia sp. RSA 1200]
MMTTSGHGPNIPAAGRCHHYVSSKRRFCPLTARPGATYCREHIAIHGNSNGNGNGSGDNISTIGSRRVLCPYDTSHSVELSSLATHMRSRCNARPPDTAPPYLHPDCNVVSLPPGYGRSDAARAMLSNALWGDEGLACSDPRLVVKPGELVYPNDAAQSTQTKLDTLDTRSVARALKPVVELYLRQILPNADHLELDRKSLAELLDMVDLARDFRSDLRSHPVLDSNENAAKTKHVRHTVQQSSLLGHLDALDCLDPQKYVFVEFGAGKGELSVHLHAALAGNPTIILVDRKNFRQKFNVDKTNENSTTTTTSESNTSSARRQFTRIYIDIRDLDLSSVPELQGAVDPTTGMPALRPVVAYSKHLCGAATDLTLRCLKRYEDAGGSVAAIAIALCCHHRCRYSTYANPEYLTKTLVFSVDASSSREGSSIDKAATTSAKWNESHCKTFRQVAAMSSWAINAPPPPRPPPPLSEPSGDPNEQPLRLGLTFAQRVHAGHAVKRALDLGRFHYVRTALGMSNAELVYFISRSTSPENLALVGAKIPLPFL